MTILGLIFALVIIGFALSFIDIDATIKRAIVGIVVLVAICLVVGLFFPGVVPAGLRLR